MSGNLSYQLARLNMAERLIAINVGVFIITSLFTFLSGMGDGFLAWFQLPQDIFDFMVQPWSLVTYSFLHSGFFHLFWNMLLLYFTGRIFLNLFNAQRLLNVYFMGVIAGGLLFMLAYNIFPRFFWNKDSFDWSLRRCDGCIAVCLHLYPQPIGTHYIL